MSTGWARRFAKSWPVTQAVGAGALPATPSERAIRIAARAAKPAVPRAKGPGCLIAVTRSGWSEPLSFLAEAAIWGRGKATPTPVFGCSARRPPITTEGIRPGAHRHGRGTDG